MSRAGLKENGISKFFARVRSLIAIALMAACWPAFCATATDLPLSLMSHKTWTARDGAPQGVRALAQAPDGTLWIGTDGGLFNFDGLAFRPFRPLPGEPGMPGGSILCLHIARDGTLWVGTFDGVVHIASQHVRRYSSIGGARARTVNFIAESADGSIWAAGQAAVFHIDPDGKEHPETAPGPTTKGPLGGLFIDKSNTLWIAQGLQLFRRPLDQAEYFPTGVAVDFTWQYAGMPDGSLWIADVDTKVNEGRYQHVDRSGKLLARLAYRVMPFALLPLNDGSLLIGTQGHGLQRFREPDKQDAAAATAPPAAESFAHVDGLSANETRALFIDDDGSIWVGGRRGLDRFRPAQLTPFLPEGVKEGDDGWSVCSNRPGEVWVSYVNGLFRQTEGPPTSFPDLYGAYIYCARSGEVWLMNSRGIWDLRADPVAAIPPVPGFVPYAYKQVVSNSRRTVFAFVSTPVANAGVWKFESGEWTRLSSGSPPLYAYIDSTDRLWTGGSDGFVERPTENQRFSTGDPGLEAVYALLETPLAMLAAGTNGLAVLRGDRFEPLLFADTEVAHGIGSMIDSLDGDLWLNAPRGIVHVRRSELEAALKDARYPMKSELVTEGEFVGPVSLLYKATAARDADGRLWFATLNGVFHLDPAHLLPASRPPVLSIRSLVVDGVPLGSGATIGANPQTLVIQYFGVNLTMPERVTYQYRLGGFEDTWQDAGKRTEAIYARLPPGTYSFEVRASNGDGQWTAPVSAPAFSVTPAFYQRAWFKLLAAAAVLLALLGIFKFRVRVVARSIRARAEARADERVRIARDLHDTLLQGVQGLLLNFHVAAVQTPDDAPFKPLLQRALSSADDIILEGRDRVSRLRAEHLTDAELIDSIKNVGRDLATGDGTQFSVKRYGSPVALHAHVADEVFHMAREALTNAFRHARATQINVELIYGQRFFSVSCEDNGSGFSPGDAEKRGHWGVKGMAERASRLGGNLQCRSELLRGTNITVEIPSYRAYRGHSRVMFHLRALRTRS